MIKANSNPLTFNYEKIEFKKISNSKKNHNEILNDFKESLEIKNKLYEIQGREWPHQLNGQEDLEISSYKTKLLKNMDFFNVVLRDDSQIPVDGPSLVHIANTFVRFDKTLYSLFSKNNSGQTSDGITVTLTDFFLAKKGDKAMASDKMISLSPLLIKELINQKDKRKALEEIFYLCFYFSNYNLSADHKKLFWVSSLRDLESLKDWRLSKDGIDKLEKKIRTQNFPVYFQDQDQFSLASLVKTDKKAYYIELTIKNNKLHFESTKVAENPSSY
jgi:hypothetical protein